MDMREAKDIVTRVLNENFHVPGDKLVIVDEYTIEKYYGWIFFFNSERFLQTGNIFASLGGNGPVAFEVLGRRVTMLGSGREPEEEIRLFEQKKGLL